jgi:hypothetical protein
LLSEDQCKARDARRKSKQKPTIKKEVASPDSNEGTFGDTASSMSDPRTPPAPTAPTLTPPSDGIIEGDPLCMLNAAHSDLIRNLTTLQEKLEFPNPEEVERATVCYWGKAQG